MATTIVTKNSSTASAVPTAGQLVQGELAVNVADKRLYTEDNAGAIVELGTNPSTLTVTGEITANGGIALGDNDKATFGAGDDLQIYHDGSNNHTYVKETGSGNLYVQANNLRLQSAGGANYAQGIDGDAFKLYFNDVEKLATTSTGIDVTGTVTMDGLTVDGSTTLNTPSTLFANLNYLGSNLGKFGTDGVNLNIEATNNLFLKVNSATRAKLDGNGDISFYEDTGTTPKFFWDASAESLGIGTSSPTTALDVVGTVTASGGSISGNLLVGTSLASAKLTVGTFGDTARAAQFHGDSILLDGGAASEIIIGDGNAAYMSIQTTDDATAMKIRNYSGSADLVTVERVSGNVGIGTSNATPSNGEGLCIGSGSTITRIDMRNTTTGDATGDGTSLQLNGNDFTIENREAGYVAISTSLTERMRIDSSGRVGIGTSSPNATLEATKAITFSNVDTIGQFLIKSAAGATGDMLNFGVDSANSLAFIQAVEKGIDIIPLVLQRYGGNVGIGVVPSTPLHVKVGTNQNLEIDSAGSELRLSAVNDARSANPAIRFQAESYKFYGSGGVGPRATIDASGNLLVGKTGTNTLATAGHDFGVSGYAMHSRNSSTVFYLNRNTSDGAIQEFYKDGTIVGSIGVASEYLYINGTRSTDAGLMLGSQTVAPASSSGANRNNEIDLGFSGNAFKDLYLSGTAKSQAVELEDIKAKDTSGLNLQTSNGQKRVILDNSGNLLVGTTSTPSATQAGFMFTGDQLYTSAGASTTTNYQVRFYNGNGLVGAITTDGSATAYLTSSDQRLKENIVDANDAGSKIDAIQVRQYDWKADGSHQDYGMIAQELQLVAPEAVSGDADSEEMMGVDYSKLVPMLIKEIQSLRNRVAQLEGI